jgi:hypothetical protein
MSLCDDSEMVFRRVRLENADVVARSIPRVSILEFEDCEFTDDGWGAIATAFDRVAYVEICHSTLGWKTAEALCDKLHMHTALKTMSLFGNGLGDEGVTAIASFLPATGITALLLHSNEIGAEGAKALARGMGNLTTLDIRSNHIGDEGCVAVASALGGQGHHCCDISQQDLDEGEPRLHRGTGNAASRRRRCEVVAPDDGLHLLRQHNRPQSPRPRHALPPPPRSPGRLARAPDPRQNVCEQRRGLCPGAPYRGVSARG